MSIEENSDIIREEYANEPRLRDMRITLFSWPRWILLACIRAYQAVISPVLGSNVCRFYPSCSHYGYQAIYKYGVLRGCVMAIKRLLRCNPYNSGGFDPLP